MAVTLIYNNSENTPLAENIVAVALPSFKILTRDNDSDIPDHLGGLPDRWKANENNYRSRIVENSTKFFEDNFADGELSAPDAGDSEMPVSAFYSEILRLYDTQVMSSGIFSDDEARELLKDEGWFNANKKFLGKAEDNEAQDGKKEKDEKKNPEIWWIYDGRGVYLGNISLGANGSYNAQISKDDNNPYFDELIHITGPLGRGGDEFKHSVVITNVDKDEVIEAYNNAGFAVVLAGDKDHEEILIELDKLRKR